MKRENILYFFMDERSIIDALNAASAQAQSKWEIQFMDDLIKEYHTHGLDMTMTHEEFACMKSLIGGLGAP